MVGIDVGTGFGAVGDAGTETGAAGSADGFIGGIAGIVSLVFATVVLLLLAAGYCALTTRSNATARAMKKKNIALVAQVSTSPVFAPKAVVPPDPPKELDNPPPRPF